MTGTRIAVFGSLALTALVTAGVLGMQFRLSEDSTGTQLASSKATEEVDALSRHVAGESGTSAERAQRLVTWINTNFQWTATDYQQRTAEEIIERRGGNCAELSRVLARMLEPAGIRYRWVREINIHPYSIPRQQTAERLVQEKGLGLSVFGLRHNDHMWLEIYDDSVSTWIPADPSVGVVGVQPWVKFRAGLGRRPQPAVPAVADIVKEMIVPVAVVVPGRGDQPSEDRSSFYLVEELNRAYGGRLSSLPAWREWSRGIREFSPLALQAFGGKINLHEHSEMIVRVAETYERLRREAKAQGIIGSIE